MAPRPAVSYRPAQGDLPARGFGAIVTTSSLPDKAPQRHYSSLSRRALLIVITTVALGVVGSAQLGVGPTTAAPSAAQAETGSAQPAAIGGAAEALSFQPVLGLPSREVQLIGASSEEVWAQANIGAVPATANGQQIADATVLLHHSAAGGGWLPTPIEDAQGNPLQFVPASDHATGMPADRVTAAGGIVLLGSNSTGTQGILEREPGGAFAAAPQPSSSGPQAVLGSAEALFTASSSPLVAAIDEAGGATGALVVPQRAEEGAGGGGTTGTSLPPGVLHYDGTRWTREPICAREHEGTCTPESELTVLAIAAASPQSAWLLASSGAQPLMLFQRDTSLGGVPVWVLQETGNWMLQPKNRAPAGSDVNPLAVGPMLTATDQGVWVDAQLEGPSSEGGSAHGDVTLLVSGGGSVEVRGTWCYPQRQLCPQNGSLPAPLPEGFGSRGYESFAWPGVRIIAGLPRGALLRFTGGNSFSYLPGGGGFGVSSAAFITPQEGWLYGSSGGSGGSLNYHEGAQLLHVSTSPEPNQLQQWPLPFRRPLTAIAGAPGASPGEPNAQALAVGAEGQVARYTPGQGWAPEYLYNSSGMRQEPSLRGVAWPEAGRAYAVGSEGAMWLWRSETNLWESDPAKPLGFHGNLTAIAFDPTDPAVGYAVGKQGVLLSYGKTWSQAAALPAGLQEANFTSIAFAGGEAIVGYRMLGASGKEVGGLIVNRDEAGSVWEVDTEAQKLLAQLSEQEATVISKVAGLPDGGAVAAGPGIVIERDGPAGSPWRFAPEPLPEAANIAALAAFREGPRVRALVSIDTSANSLPDGLIFLAIDNPPGSAPGQPPLYLEPDPLPATGYLLRENAGGWQDLEGDAFPDPEIAAGQERSDLPAWPDPVLALLVGPTGAEGWAVGGQTGSAFGQSALKEDLAEVQTAAALRLGAGAAPPQNSDAPISAPAGEATFALGGNAQCAAACADYANVGVGPDAWLTNPIARSTQVPGLRAFLYTGGRVAQSKGQRPTTEAFQREVERYAELLHSGGSFPVYAAASPSDVQPGGGVGVFTSVMAGNAPAGSVPAGTAPPPSGSAAYAFDSEGAGGPVCVIVLDYSQQILGAAQLEWLASQLESAKAAGRPAIVIGNADPVDPTASNYAHDATALAQVLVQHGASAYFYDSPEENRSDTLSVGSRSVPAYGSGTLGYVLPPPATDEEFLGAGGFLLASVNVAARSPQTNQAPVTVTLTPNISQLALNATDGTFLRRSQVALFEGLARRPAGGAEQEGSGTGEEEAPNPYVPIPEYCKGPGCAHFIAPSYTFSSSRPDIGNFVEREPASSNPRAVLQGAGGKPIPDPSSGLFCAFNAGTTTVTITTGGLSYSEQVTVQAGSVEQPCGTVPLINPPPATSNTAVPSPLPPPSPSPTPGTSPTPIAPPPPPAPLAAPQSPAAHPNPPHVAVPAFFLLPPQPFAPVLAPLVVSPTLARPIPPSGSAPVSVFSPAVAPEEQREEEEAIESVHNMAVYDPAGPTLPPISLLGLIVLAAGAGTTIRRASRGRGVRRAPALARVGASASRRRQGRG